MTEAKIWLSTSGFSRSVFIRLSVVFIRRHTGFFSDLPVEALLAVLCIPCRVQLQHAFADLTLSQHNQSTSLYSYQDTDSFKSSLSHAEGSSLLFLISFIWVQEVMHCIESIPKDLPRLFFSLVPQGTFPWGPLLTKSFKSWKFAFLKFTVLTLIFVLSISLRTVNLTSAWSRQSRLPPILMSLISSQVLMTSRSRKAFPQARTGLRT